MRKMYICLNLNNFTFPTYFLCESLYAIDKWKDINCFTYLIGKYLGLFVRQATETDAG